MTKSKTRSLNIVGILTESIYKIVVRYSFQTDILVYNFQRPSSKYKKVIYIIVKREV